MRQPTTEPRPATAELTDNAFETIQKRLASGLEEHARILNQEPGLRAHFEQEAQEYEERDSGYLDFLAAFDLILDRAMRPHEALAEVRP